jgi:hypothetical protein
MSIFAGDNSDLFFQKTGVADDTQSPQLEGAINITVPGGLPVGSLQYHNDERVRPDIVAVYLKFLQDQALDLQQGGNGDFRLAQPGMPRSGASPTN